MYVSSPHFLASSRYIFRLSHRPFRLIAGQRTAGCGAQIEDPLSAWLLSERRHVSEEDWVFQVIDSGSITCSAAFFVPSSSSHSSLFSLPRSPPPSSYMQLSFPITIPSSAHALNSDSVPHTRRKVMAKLADFEFIDAPHEIQQSLDGKQLDESDSGKQRGEEGARGSKENWRGGQN